MVLGSLDLLRANWLPPEQASRTPQAEAVEPLLQPRKSCVSLPLSLWVEAVTSQLPLEEMDGRIASPPHVLHVVSRNMFLQHEFVRMRLENGTGLTENSSWILSDFFLGKGSQHSKSRIRTFSRKEKQQQQQTSQLGLYTGSRIPLAVFYEHYNEPLRQAWRGAQTGACGSSACGSSACLGCYAGEAPGSDFLQPPLSQHP